MADQILASIMMSEFETRSRPPQLGLSLGVE